MRHWLVSVFFAFSVCSSTAADDNPFSKKLVLCGGGSLPDVVYERFLALAGPQPILVVIPTASMRTPDKKQTQELWESRGFTRVSILHSNDPDVASSDAFAEPLKTATAVWFGGGSQQRIADAYVGTPVESELDRLLQRGGVIGGTSAGAAIQSRVMIASGKTDPKISTGFDLLHAAIVDQHFLARNRITRLTTAVRTHPDLIGFGIDESTALVTDKGRAEVVGRSYVVRVESVDGKIKLDAFEHGEEVPLASESTQGI